MLRTQRNCFSDSATRLGLAAALHQGKPPGSPAWNLAVWMQPLNVYYAKS